MRIRKSNEFWIVCLAAALALACAPEVGEDTSVLVPISEGSVSGAAVFVGNEVDASLSVSLEGLTPMQFYLVRAGGLPVGITISDEAGNAVMRQSVSSGTSPGGLDVDPRGRTLSVEMLGGPVVAHAVVSGAGEPASSEVREQTFLARLAATQGSARARFRLESDGRRRFSVELEDVEPGRYEVFVDGVPRGELDAPSGVGEREFDSNPGEAGAVLLDFDPRGSVIDVVRDGQVAFSGPLEAQLDGLSRCVFVETESLLTPTPAGAGGKAKVRARTRDDCDRDLRIEVESLLGGSFEVLVNGQRRAVITTVFDATEGIFEGEVEFDSDPDEPGELLLDFEVLGMPVEVRQAGVVHFAAESFGDAMVGGPPAGICTEEETTTPLFGPPGSTGESRVRVGDDCDTDLRVEIEDVPVGTYELFVGGVSRAFFEVEFDPTTGAIEGEVEFDSDPDDPGELLLTFDPRRLAVAVVSIDGATVIDDGGGGGPPGACGASETELPLLVIGPVPLASGKARYRSHADCDEDLRVEVEDLPAGSYRLLVDGVDRGEITVAALPGGTEGEIQFDTDPDDPGDVLLDFDARGALIQIRQGGAILLERKLPD